MSRKAFPYIAGAGKPPLPLPLSHIINSYNTEVLIRWKSGKIFVIFPILMKSVISEELEINNRLGKPPYFKEKNLSFVIGEDKDA